jgi:ubiquinol-cytochrome c reductase cytochrome c subunit
MPRQFVVPAIAVWGAAICLLLLASGTTGNASAPPPTVRPDAAAADGATLFQSACSSCHGAEAQGGFTAPSLHGLPFGEDTVRAVEQIVRDGTDEMDPLGDELTDEQIAAVSAYAVSAFGAPGDVALGGELFRLNCAGCHGAAGRGGALIYSDTNAPSLSGGSKAITVGAIRGGPGTMPPFSQAALPDDAVASVAVYVALLRDPPHPGGVLVPPPGPVTEGLLAGLIGLGTVLLAAAWVTRGGRG